MVREVAKNLKPPTQQTQPCSERKKRDFLPTAKSDFVVAAVGNCENTDLNEGFARAMELVGISEKYLMKMYRLMQPNSGTKADYITLAAALLTEFSAEKNADMIIRIMQRFDKNGQLLKN